MEADFLNIAGAFVLVLLTISWFCMLGFAIFSIILWFKLFKDSNRNGGFLSKIIPIFIFNSSILSDEEKTSRKKFFKVFVAFLCLVILNIALLFFVDSMPALKFPEGLY
ncbi:hypothetical protein [Zooshikella ganghwensis]|uniref:hypothetical protein n=1 Tax=Zooshikella ganghwensis TaxID=202772 RepID=UPI0004270CC2|nr:hypothetical protein [Zooshikella ganghwensis]